MSLTYNYERENKLFLEEYCEFVEWKTAEEKLDAIADMYFLLEWMLCKDEWEDYDGRISSAISKARKYGYGLSWCYGLSW